MGIRILVCGGRDYHEYNIVDSVLTLANIKHGVDLIIEGGAKGADAHAATWADKNQIPRMTFHANWKIQGPKAGPIRNGNMLKFGKPDWVIAFRGGKGTANMVKQARDAGFNVWEVMKDAEKAN